MVQFTAQAPVASRLSPRPVAQTTVTMKLLHHISLHIRVFVTACLLAFIVPSILIIILIPCKVFEGISRITAFIFRKDLEQVFTDAGLVFALDPPHVCPKVTILAFLVCDGPVCLESLRSNFTFRVLNYQDDQGRRPFAHLKDYWVQFMGYYYWKKDNDFRIENHVRMYDYSNADCLLPASCSQKDLQRVGGVLMTEPFPKRQSPWEMLVIPNYKFEQDGEVKLGTVLALRIHHALADGYSLMSLLYHLFDYKPGFQPANFVKISSFALIIRQMQILLMLPWNLAKFSAFTKDPPSAWNLVGKEMTYKNHVFVSNPIGVDTVKAIARSYGVTYNAVITCVTMGAVVRMMRAAGHELPKKFTCTFTLPLPDHPGGLTNHAGVWFFNIHPQDMDTYQRLRQISKALKPASIFQTTNYVFPWLSKLLRPIPAPLIKSFHLSSNITLGSTSSRGAPNPIPISQSTHLVDCFVVLAPGQKNSGAGFCEMTSFAGKQRITLILDRSVQFGCPVDSLDFEGFVDHEIMDLLNMKEKRGA